MQLPAKFQPVYLCHDQGQLLVVGRKSKEWAIYNADQERFVGDSLAPTYLTYYCGRGEMVSPVMASAVNRNLVLVTRYQMATADGFRRIKLSEARLPYMQDSYSCYRDNTLAMCKAPEWRDSPFVKILASMFLTEWEIKQLAKLKKNELFFFSSLHKVGSVFQADDNVPLHSPLIHNNTVSALGGNKVYNFPVPMP